MTNPGNYPSPVFDCPPQAPVLKPQWGTSSEPSKFQAARDWSWSEPQSSFAPPQPPGPWNWNPNPHGNWHGGPWHQNHGPNRYRGGQHHGRQDFGGKRNNKRESEFSFFCDTCDRGFKDQGKYDEHLSQHVKCTVADCSFTAHEKLVKIHWRNSHAPGTKRIKLDTPEEIAKWREERRRNYPTLANVEKKVKVMEAKEERGEVLETAQFGRMKGRGRGRGRGRGGHRGRGFRGRGWGRDGSFHSNPTGGDEEQQHQHQQQQQPVTQPPKEVDPLGALANSDPDSDREVSGEAEAVSVAPKSVSSALASLVASYGGMTDSESDQEPEAAPILKTSRVLEENKALLHRPPGPASAPPPPRVALQGSSVPMARASLGYTPPRGRGRKRGRGGRHQHGGHPHPRRHTLLEMLLAPDIRHERNVLLQCVRFIVRNGFFGLEQSGDDGDVGVGTGRQRDQSGADDGSRSERGIDGRTRDSSRTSSQSTAKDTPQNDSPGGDHQCGHGNPGMEATGNGHEREGNVPLAKEEEGPVSEIVRSTASEAASNTPPTPSVYEDDVNTHPTPSVYEDDVWEVDGINSMGEEAQESGGMARKGCDSGMNGIGGMHTKQCNPLEEGGEGTANGLREDNLGMDVQPASSAYDDDIWETPSGNAEAF